MPQLVPQPRVDSLVNDGATREQRYLAEYSGTAWYGEPPNTGGPIVGFTRELVNEDSAFFLPDSLPYRGSDLGGATISCSVALQAHSGEASFVTAAEASWADDPRGGDNSWIQLRLSVYGQTPLAVSYRVVAMCPTVAVVGGPAIDLRGMFGG